MPSPKEDKMTEEELFFENETRKHQQKVSEYLIRFSKQLLPSAAAACVAATYAAARKKMREKILNYGIELVAGTNDSK